MENDGVVSYFFHHGTNFKAYEYMGAHIEGKSVVFRVWAPNADEVTVTGDFCNWDPDAYPMERITEKGILQARIPLSLFEAGMNYKFCVKSKNGVCLKSDPYAFASQTLKNTASVVTDLSGYAWNDGNWLEYRKEKICDCKYSLPINIYEVHLASWRTRNGRGLKDGHSYLNYREIAEELVPYVKEMGYTHVELLPVMEHPFDGSWGYQVCGYYAPTQRFGSPQDFMYFVDTLHKNGIGVILDWVPAHFPKDEHGLYEFDGTPLYEYAEGDRKENNDWGMQSFDIGKNEVRSFLISNAMFWFDVYHVDGLRVDSAASMLYLDYGRKEGEWTPNVYGDYRNLDAEAFFKKLNDTVKMQFPDVLMIAEDSYSRQKITSSRKSEGLGFSFKWNIGMTDDLLEYVKCDPFFRKYHHGRLTNSAEYAFGENYIIPISHDEVVYGKKSVIDKMFGCYEDKFSGYRALLCHIMAHPGKKLTFMGCEFGQFREWDYENQLEWFMLDYVMHRKFKAFVADINDLYLRTPQLWQMDHSSKGFRWINSGDSETNIISYARTDEKGKDLVAVMNFSGVDRINYYVYVKEPGTYDILLNSDDSFYGGSGAYREQSIHTDTDVNGEHYLSLRIAKLSGMYLRLKDRSLRPVAD